MTGGRDGENNAPTGHIDSLVVKVVDRGVEMARTMHQRVILTRWWSKVVDGGGDGENNAPASHIDSLVV